jgi:hypothetical protein
MKNSFTPLAETASSSGALPVRAESQPYSLELHRGISVVSNKEL